MDAIKNYADDVMKQEFPNDSESFQFSDEEEAELKKLLSSTSAV